jgi:predicted O-methyltransferase YrrM
MRKEITDLDRYLESLHTSCSQVLPTIEKALKEDGKWGINIGLMEGLILQWLIKSHKVVKILEIGTQYGYSTQWMLEALPPSGQIITLEKDPGHYAKARSFITDSRVEFKLGDAEQILPQLEKQAPFDFIFIDANKKSYPFYLKWAEKYLRSGGFLAGDNSLLFGHALKNTPDEDTPVELWTAMREFNKSIFTNKNFIPCFIPTPEGLTLACKV